MRIVGGDLRGRVLATPADASTRPTSDRVRESLFNILEHHSDVPELDGARVIDLFAGTGALGLEALSRGARWALFVEQDARARAVIRQNIEALGLQGRTKLFRRDATSLGPAGNLAGFRFAFLDPPYGKGLAEQALIELRDGGWLQAGAIAVVEERASVQLELPDGFVQTDERRYGDSSITLCRYTGPDASTTRSKSQDTLDGEEA